jgi:hypothetical protein
MGVTRGDWTILGTALRCQGVPDEATSGLEALLRGFPPADADGPALEIRIEAVGAGRFRLSEPGDGSRWEVSAAEAPLSSHLEYRLVNEAIQRAASRHVLHAGAVADSAGTCLIVGDSGAGKTSLTLWLWASGFRLATDDLCPILRPSLLPETFPRSLHMDCEYSPRLLERIPPRPPGFPADYYPFPAVPDEPLPPVRRLLVLERGPDPAGSLEPIGQAEAAHRLLAQVIRNPAFRFEEALEDMIRLAGSCEAWRLRAGSPEGAADRALELLSPKSAG